MAFGLAKTITSRTLVVGSAVAIAAATSLVVAPAAQAAAHTITVTVQSGGSPVAGALVSADLANASPSSVAQISNGSGVATLNVPSDGIWAVTASKAGFQVASQDVTAESDPPPTLALTASSANFSNVPVFGAQGSQVAAGAAGGEFYATTSVIPQVFRTIDYGGTWTPATVGFDDSSKGLPSTNTASNLTTSGVAGEVAVSVGGNVYFSKDYGNTWTVMLLAAGNQPQLNGNNSLWWGHQGTTSTMLAKSGSHTYVADMSSATPTFSVKDFSTLSTDIIQVANGGDEPWVAVGSGTTVTISPLTATGAVPDAQAKTINAGATVDCVAIGGRPGAAGEPPAAAFWSTSGAGQTSNLSFEAAGLYGPPTTAAESSTASCNGGTTAGFNDNGHARSEIVNASDTTELRLHAGGFYARYVPTTLTIEGDGASPAPPNDANGDGPAGVYSAGYSFTPSNPGPGDNVFMHTQGDRGFAKSTAFKTATGTGQDHSTTFEPYQIGVSNASLLYQTNVYNNATAGIARNSGGGSVSGIASATTKDISAYAGDDVSRASVMLSMSGGGQGLVTTDGGASFKAAVNKGGNTTAYWDDGASGTWLVYGHPDGSGIQYTLIKDWTDTDTPRTNGSQDHTIHDGVVTAMQGTGEAPTGLAAIPKTSKVLGTTAGSSDGGVFRATLSGTKNSEAAGGIVSSSFSAKANSVAYCPGGGTDNALDDTAFVGLGNDDGSGAALQRISSASTTSDLSGTSVTGIPTGKGAIVDVDVNCDTGVIAVAGKDGLFVSQDAGVTWMDVSITTGNGTFRAIAVQKKDAASAATTKIVAARGNDGYTYQSSDGGANWVIVNNPLAPSGGGRSFSSEGINALAFPGNAAAAASSAGARSARSVSRHSVGAETFSDTSSLAGSGAGTASLSSGATGSSAGHATGGGTGGGGTGTGGGGSGPGTGTGGGGNASLTTQTVSGTVKLTLKKGKAVTLPKKTVQGQTLTWKSSKAAICKIAKGKVTGKKKGKCTLTAQAGGTSTLAALTKAYAVKVK